MLIKSRNAKVKISLEVMNSYNLHKKVLQGKYAKTMLRNNKKNYPLVLLFSKETELRILLEAFLKVWNCDVCEADNEADLLQIAESRTPSLMLFDFSLSFEDDLEILRRTREIALFKNLPILAVSGHARRGDPKTALQAGASEYVLKPIDFERLESLIKKYCAECQSSFDENPGVRL